MKTSPFLVIIVLIGLACGPTAQQETEQYGQWSTMVGSNTLPDQAWKDNSSAGYQVEDSVLSLESKDTWLVYDRVLDDFVFETEFQLEKGGRAVVAFRSEAAGQEADGYQVNLDHDIDQQNTLGSIIDIARAKTLKSTQPETWASLTIEARGDHLKIFVNDTLVTETHHRRSGEGRIALQAKDGIAKFKKVRVKALEDEDYLGPLMEEYMRSYEDVAMVPLADSTSLSDWYQVGDAQWDISNGVIHGYSGQKGGFLVHKQNYKNFYLKLKFKIAHEDNSGIFIRHNPSDSLSVTTDNAIECNIYDHNGYTHEFSTGAITPIARAWSKMITYDQWNEMEIFAFEDQICMYVNGQKSSEAHLPEPYNRTGNICLQGGIQVFNDNQPSEVYIKDLYIKNFDQVPSLGF